MNEIPRTLPLTVEQYRILVEQNALSDRRGQVELIYGRIVEFNPQGPMHADPIDELDDWSHKQAGNYFRIRIEKPIEIPGLNSCPEPDVAWVTRRRYSDRHPVPNDIHLLIEVSVNSQSFDRGEKKRLYAEAQIAEYWVVDVMARTIEKMSEPVGGEYRTTEKFGVDDVITPRCLRQASLPVARLFGRVDD